MAGRMDGLVRPSHMIRTAVLIVSLLGVAMPSFAHDRPESASQPSITCKLGALAPAQRARHSALVRELMGTLPVATSEVEYGYVFEYRRDPAILAKLAEWIALESQCCEFFTFSIAVAEQNGPIRLTWAGSEAAAKAIITTTVAPVNPSLTSRRR